MIEFRKLSDLSEILCIHSVLPHKIGTICAASSAALVFSDISRQPCDVLKLDCSEPEPKIQDLNYFPDLDFNHLCIVKKEAEVLAIVTFHCDGLFVKNFESGELMYDKAFSPIIDVCSDGHGHLFVLVGYRGESCIEMLRVSDGQYLGCVLQAKDLEFEDIYSVCWVHDTSSFVILHRKDDKCLVSTVRLEPSQRTALP